MPKKATNMGFFYELLITLPEILPCNGRRYICDLQVKKCGYRKCFFSLQKRPKGYTCTISSTYDLLVLLSKDTEF
jgi:hypothetical protein